MYHAIPHPWCCALAHQHHTVTRAAPGLTPDVLPLANPPAAHSNDHGVSVLSSSFRLSWSGLFPPSALPFASSAVGVLSQRPSAEKWLVPIDGLRFGKESYYIVPPHLCLSHFRFLVFSPSHWDESTAAGAVNPLTCALSATAWRSLIINMSACVSGH